MTGFLRWTSLNQFHEVIKNLSYPRIYNVLKENNFKIKYGLKSKIHGTNACVRIEPNGNVVAQKRSSDLKGAGDNYGFRAWVESSQRYFENLADSQYTIYVFGEWAGPGIQSDVAAGMTATRVFYPFAISFYENKDFVKKVYDPQMIEDFLSQNDDHIPDDVIVLPWIAKLELNFESKMDTETSLAKINVLTERIGKCDPFFKDNFDIEGSGEGVVAFPWLGKEYGQYSADDDTYFSWFNFKAKSEAHRVNKTKKAVSFDPEKFNNINRFVDAFVTENRLQQGLREAVDSRYDIKLMSEFIKWVCKDVQKESATELEESGLEWSAVSKVVATRSAVWYKDQIQQASLVTAEI